MKKNAYTLRTILLFLLAVSLLTVGGIGTARAVPLIKSEDYSGGVEMFDIGVALVENGSVVSGELLSAIGAGGKEFHLGQTYTEKLSVRNSGSIDTYVRATVYRYWQDGNGRKLTALSPDMIDLELDTGSGWVVDKEASSAERTVLYYTALVPAGADTRPFSKTLTVSGEIPYQATQTTSGGVITTTYDYNGVTFQLEVHVDAVQTHSAQLAIRSAWGRPVSVSGEKLSLG